MKIAILFKSEVRYFNEEIIAGCERVFLNEVLLLSKKNLLSKAWMAADFFGKSSTSKVIRKIYYPHRIIDEITKLNYKCDFFYRLISKLLLFIKYFSEIFYSFIFILNEFKSDIFYVYQEPIVAFLFPKKTILAYHNCSNISLLKNKRIFSHTRIIFCSNSLLKQISSLVPINSKNSFVVYNSVSEKTIAKKFGNNKKIKFIYASQWNKNKGFEHLLSLAKYLGNKFQDTSELYICGAIDLWSISESEYENSLFLMEKANELFKLYPNVKVIGKISHHKLQNLLKEMDYCFFPSIWPEPFSLFILESLSFGVPVLAFSVGGVSEIVIDGYNGFLAKKKTFNSLLDELNRSININESDYQEMKKNCLLSVGKFSHELRIGNLLKIFNL